MTQDRDTGSPQDPRETTGQTANPHREITDLFLEHARPRVVSGGRASAFLRFTYELIGTIPVEQGQRVIKVVASGKPHQAESSSRAVYRVNDSQNPDRFITVTEKGLDSNDDRDLETIVGRLLEDLKDPSVQFTSEFKVENPNNVTAFQITREDGTIAFDVPRMRIGPNLYI